MNNPNNALTGTPTGWRCPGCGVMYSPLVSQCGPCSPSSVPVPFIAPQPPAPPVFPPFDITKITWTPQQGQPCAFDNLPPGAYGLVCQCPRCTPQCSTSAAS